jgi:hypothetical protein
MKTRKPARTKKRAINKSVDRRFTMRNQRASVDDSSGGKGLADIQDIPRQRKSAKGPGRVQLGRTLNQGELADKDPVKED